MSAGSPVVSDDLVTSANLLVHLDAGKTSSSTGTSTWTNIAPSTGALWQGKNATWHGFGSAVSYSGSNTTDGSNGHYHLDITSYSGSADSLGFATMDHGSTVTNGLEKDWTYFAVIRSWTNMSGTSWHSMFDSPNDENLFATVGGKLMMYNPSYTVTDNTVVANETWMSLAITSEVNTAGNQRLFKHYIDGSLIHTVTVTAASVVNIEHDARYLSIGAGSNGSSGSGGNEHFKGKMGVMMIYKQTLTASEILQNHNHHKTRYGLA